MLDSVVVVVLFVSGRATVTMILVTETVSWFALGRRTGSRTLGSGRGASGRGASGRGASGRGASGLGTSGRGAGGPGTSGRGAGHVLVFVFGVGGAGSVLVFGRGVVGAGAGGCGAGGCHGLAGRAEVTMVFVTETVSRFAHRSAFGHSNLAVHSASKASHSRKRAHHGAGDHRRHGRLGQRMSPLSIRHIFPRFSFCICQ